MEELHKCRQKDFEIILDACQSKNQPVILESAEKLAKVSTNHFLAAFEFEYRQINREGPSQLLLCVGTELLLNAIVIKNAPDIFYGLCHKKNKSVTFDVIKNRAQQIIVSNFEKKQKDRMVDVLDLIENKRNIFVHFSFGIHAYYYQHYEMLNAICYLLTQYFPKFADDIKTLEIMKEKFRPKQFKNYDYVNFESTKLAANSSAPLLGQYALEAERMDMEVLQ